MTTMTVNRPVEFPGTVEEARANYLTHNFYDFRCLNCDCNEWGTTKDYPCGVNPPRETVNV